MPHCRRQRRHPIAALFLTLFLLLVLAGWIGWGGVLVLAVAVVLGALIVRADRSAHGRR